MNFHAPLSLPNENLVKVTHLQCIEGILIKRFHVRHPVSARLGHYKIFVSLPIQVHCYSSLLSFSERVFNIYIKF